MRRFFPAPLALAMLLVCAIYGPRLSAPFAWDDLLGIAYSGTIDKPAPWRAYFSGDFFRLSPFNNTWRPLSHLAMRTVARVAGKSPAAHRLPGLLLHLLCGFLLLGLALSFGLPRDVAAWAAALFLVHPVHAESLMCASHLSTVLTGAGLLAMLCFHRQGRGGLAAGSFAVAMLSKEHGLLGLPLAWFSDVLGKRVSTRRLAALGVVAGAYFLVRFIWLPGTSSEQRLGSAIPFGDRLVLAAQAWLVSWRVLAAPVWLRVEYFAVPPASWLERAAWLLAAAGSAAALGWAAFRLRDRAPVLSFALAWPALFLIVISPLAPENVLNLRLTAERFLYAPAMGFTLLLAWALRGQRLGLALILAAWTILSFRRAGDWADEPRLWTSLAEIYPWSSKAHEGAAEAWLRRGRYAEGALEYEAALRVRRNREDLILAHYVPLTNELSWERSSIHRGLGRARLQLGDVDGAAAAFKQAIEVSAAQEDYSFRALSYLEARRGRFAEARRVAEKGLVHHPADPLLARLARDAAGGRLGFGLRFD